MKKITKKWLEKNNACESGVELFEKLNSNDPIKLFDLAIIQKKYQDINWCISRYLRKCDKIKYAIFAAEQVIEIFELKYTNDQRPRNAINAAKKYLKLKNNDAAAAAAYVAAVAADAAADDAARAASAAYVAARAAYVAAAAARAAARAARAAVAADAARAARAADDAARAAYVAAYADKEKMYIKILNYGIELIKKY